MIVDHYVCDVCGHDTTRVLAAYELPMNGIVRKEIHLCPECIKMLNDFLTRKAGEK